MTGCTIQSGQFRRLIRDAARIAVSTVSTVAAARYIKLFAEETGRVTATATDAETHIELFAEGATVPKSGTYMLPSDISREICDVIPDNAEVHVSDNGDGSVTVKCGADAKWHLLTIPAEDFPDNAFANEEAVAVIEGTSGEVFDALASVLYAAPAKDHRRVLVSVAIDNRGDSSEPPMLVATDGKTLAAMPCSGVEYTVPSDSLLTIPRAFVELAARTSRDRDDKVRIVLGARRIRLEYPFGVLSAQMIEGKYPDWRLVIPKEFLWHIPFKKTDMMLNVNRASKIGSKDKKSHVRQVILTFEGMFCTISAKSADEGSFSSRIPLETEAPERIEIMFAASVLLDTLDHCEGERVTMLVKSASSPVLFSGSDDVPGGIRVAMPIKMAEVRE